MNRSYIYHNNAAVNTATQNPLRSFACVHNCAVGTTAHDLILTKKATVYDGLHLLQARIHVVYSNS